jgi:hypothetical protein
MWFEKRWNLKGLMIAGVIDGGRAMAKQYQY